MEVAIIAIKMVTMSGFILVLLSFFGFELSFGFSLVLSIR